MGDMGTCAAPGVYDVGGAGSAGQGSEWWLEQGEFHPAALPPFCFICGGNHCLLVYFLLWPPYPLVQRLLPVLLPANSSPAPNPLAYSASPALHPCLPCSSPPYHYAPPHTPPQVSFGSFS